MKIIIDIDETKLAWEYRIGSTRMGMVDLKDQNQLRLLLEQIKRTLEHEFDFKVESLEVAVSL